MNISRKHLWEVVRRTNLETYQTGDNEYEAKSPGGEIVVRWYFPPAVIEAAGGDEGNLPWNSLEFVTRIEIAGTRYVDYVIIPL